MMGIGIPRKNKSSERMVGSGVRCFGLRSGVAETPAVRGRQAGDERPYEQGDE